MLFSKLGKTGLNVSVMNAPELTNEDTKALSRSMATKSNQDALLDKRTKFKGVNSQK